MIESDGDKALTEKESNGEKAMPAKESDGDKALPETESDGDKEIKSDGDKALQEPEQKPNRGWFDFESKIESDGDQDKALQDSKTSLWKQSCDLSDEQTDDIEKGLPNIENIDAKITKVKKKVDVGRGTNISTLMEMLRWIYSSFKSDEQSNGIEKGLPISTKERRPNGRHRMDDE